MRINLTPGILGKFGYASNLSALKRRQALAKAIVARGKEKAIDRRAAALSIFRRLNVLVLYRKNAPPSKAKSAFEADKAWVKKTYLSPPRMKKRAAARAEGLKVTAAYARSQSMGGRPAMTRRGQLTHLKVWKESDRQALDNRFRLWLGAVAFAPLTGGASIAAYGATMSAANWHWYKKYLEDREDWIEKGLKVKYPTKWEIAMAVYKPPDAEHTNVPLHTKIRLNNTNHWLAKDSKNRLYWSTVDRGHDSHPKKRAAAKAPAKRAKKRAAAKAPAKRGNGQQVFEVFGRKPKPTPKPREPSQLERWKLRNIKAREQEEERLQAIAAKQAALNEKKRLAEEREREVMEFNRLALAAANQNITREVMDTSRNREPQYTGPGVYNATLNWLTGGPKNKHWSK